MSERRLPLANRFLFNRKVELIFPRSTAFFSLSGDAIDKRVGRQVRTFAYFFSSSMEQEFASLPLAAKIGVPGGKTSNENSSFFFLGTNLISRLCARNYSQN